MNNILTYDNLSPKESVSLKDKVKWKGYGEDLLFGFIYLSKKYDNFSFPIEKLSTGNEMMWKIVVSYRCFNKTNQGSDSNSNSSNSSSNNSNNNKNMILVFPSQELKYFRQIEKYILEYRNNSKSNLTKNNLNKSKKINKNKNKIKNLNKSKKLNQTKNKNKKQFVLIPIYLGSEDCDITKGHFNIMILNLKNLTIERFEPYGSSLKQKEHKLFDKTLEKSFNSNLGKKYGKFKVIKPDSIMNKYSFQTIEENEVSKGLSNQRLSDPGGFCGVWGIWFINMRLKFPNMNTKEFLNKAEKLIKKKYNFRKFIRNYSQILIKERRKMLGGKSIQDLDSFQLSKKIIKLIK